MKAVVMHEYGGPDVLKYEDYPDPIPEKGMVLVRVAASSVNPFDFKTRSGSLKEVYPLTLPLILGVDVSGTVEAVGQGVTQFVVGEKVFAHASQTYAERCLVKETELAKVPAGFDVVNAAALPTVTSTGAQLALLALGKAGRVILVTGAAGNVGRSAVYLAKKRGATVIAGVLRKQMESADELGADLVVALDDPEAIRKLEALDAVADTVNGATAEALIRKIKDGGVFATVLGEPANAITMPAVTVKTMQVVPDPTSLATMARAVQAGELSIPTGERFALKDANRAHAAAEKGVPGKLLIVV